MAQKPSYEELEQKVHAIKKMERQLRFLSSITEQIMDSVLVTNANYELIYANAATKKTCGYDPEELIGQTLELLANSLVPEQTQKEIFQCMESGKVWTGEYLSRTKDGGTFVSEGKVSPLTDEQGRVTGYIGVQRDVSKRKQAEEALTKARDELEQRVEERTAELVSANRALVQEIEERKKTEEDLNEKSRNLEDLNTALTVLLEKRHADKAELEEVVLNNVKEQIEPYLEKLKKSRLNERQKIYTDALEKNLTNIISPFIHKLSSKYLDLTPAEIRVASLINVGKTSKEIAELLNLSLTTIAFHRDNIRSKIGIKNKKANLRSHLIALGK